MTSLKTTLAAAMTLTAVSAGEAQETRGPLGADTDYQKNIANLLLSCVRDTANENESYLEKPGMMVGGGLHVQYMNFFAKNNAPNGKQDETSVYLYRALISKGKPANGDTQMEGGITISTGTGTALSSVVQEVEMKYAFNGTNGQFSGFATKNLKTHFAHLADSEDYMRIYRRTLEMSDAIKTCVDNGGAKLGLTMAI